MFPCYFFFYFCFRCDTLVDISVLKRSIAAMFNSALCKRDFSIVS